MRVSLTSVSFGSRYNTSLVAWEQFIFIDRLLKNILGFLGYVVTNIDSYVSLTYKTQIK